MPEIVTGVIPIDDRNEIRVRVARLDARTGIDIRRWYRKAMSWFPTRRGIWVNESDASVLEDAVAEARSQLRLLEDGDAEFE